jgi:acetyl esterase/lipase
VTDWSSCKSKVVKTTGYVLFLDQTQESMSEGVMSKQLVMVNGALRALVKPVIGYMSFNPGKVKVRRPLLCSVAKFIPVPGQTQLTPIDFGPFKGEWIDTLRTNEEQKQRVILYLHGGGYLAGSHVTHRNITSRLARWGRCRVLAINYRKSPEYPFPYPIDDAVRAYEWLLEQGYSTDQIAVAGDSAGGNLTLSLLLALRDRHWPTPAAGVCLSPWTDLTCSGESMRFNRTRDPMIPAWRIPTAAKLYANGMPLDEPRISPLFANLAGLPPLLIHVGDNEVLLSDSTRFAAKARDEGVAVDLKVWPNAPHVFQIFAGIVPQSNHSLREISHFVRSVWGDRPGSETESEPVVAARPELVLVR